MVSGMMSTIFSYIWLVIVVFSPFSLLFCRKKKDDQAGKERTISGDSVKAVPRPVSYRLEFLLIYLFTLINKAFITLASISG